MRRRRESTPGAFRSRFRRSRRVSALLHAAVRSNSTARAPRPARDAAKRPSGLTFRCVHLTRRASQTGELEAFRAEMKHRGVACPDAVTCLKARLVASVQRFTRAEPLARTCLPRPAAQYVAARNGDVGAAASAFCASAAWRRATGFAAAEADARALLSIHIPFEALLLQRWPQHYLGRDTTGRPVVYEQVSQFEPREMAEHGKLTADDFVRYYMKHMTLQACLLREASAQEGRLVSRLVHVFDAAGVSLRAHLSSTARDTFSKLAAAADAHFPETLGALLIINAGGPFPVLWSVGKSFVDARTRAKIEVFAAPPARDFFAPGGWPHRVRELMGGTFPEVRAHFGFDPLFCVTPDVYPSGCGWHSTVRRRRCCTPMRSLCP